LFTTGTSVPWIAAKYRNSSRYFIMKLNKVLIKIKDAAFRMIMVNVVKIRNLSVL
jgi:hypothetical protein